MDKRPDIDDAEIKRLFMDEGWGMVQISRWFRCRHITIRRRLERMGIEPRRVAYRGPRNPRWKGGRRMHHAGYIQIYKPGHPRAYKNYVFEHIVVWEEYHNKPLPEGWIIHHINGIKSDNRPRNLLAMPKQKHSSRQLLLEVQKQLRELQIENRQLRQALESSQSIFYISEN